jgi:hypothetical protein
MTSDDRPASELRDAAALLVELARSASRYAVRGRQWDEIQRILDTISSDLGRPGPGGPGVGGPEPGATEPDRITGRVTWRGRVDQEANLLIRGSEVSVQTIAGGDATGAAFQFTSPLPARPADVKLLRTRGRGNIEIIQHPSRANDFTAIVRIRDDKGGAADYEFEMVW